MLQCSDCRKWIHYKCSDLPTYMLYSLVNSKRKYTCVNCVSISEDWLACNKDTLHCNTEKNINITLDSSIQATYEQTTQGVQASCVQHTQAIQTEGEHAERKLEFMTKCTQTEKCEQATLFTTHTISTDRI